jgi:hypothetical protein
MDRPREEEKRGEEKANDEARDQAEKIAWFECASEGLKGVSLLQTNWHVSRLKIATEKMECANGKTDEIECAEVEH